MLDPITEQRFASQIRKYLRGQCELNAPITSGRVRRPDDLFCHMDFGSFTLKHICEKLTVVPGLRAAHQSSCICYR